MSYYRHPQAANNRSYYQKRHSHEEPVNCSENSKRRRFSSPYSAPGGNNVRVSENERQKEIAVVEKPANVEEMDQTNTKVQSEELKLDKKVLEDLTKRLKDHERHLKTEMAKIEAEKANFTRINEDLNKKKRDFEATYSQVTNHNMELTNKLRTMEEGTKKVKTDLANLMSDYSKLECEMKRIKEEPGQIELTEQCAAHEAELLQLSEELKKSRAEKGEMEAKYKELKKKINELNAGNEKNKDLQLQCDNVEGEKVQLKGEIRQIKHKLRKMEADKSQSDQQMAILEKEKETLLIRCKEKDGKNEKLEKENKKLKDLIQQFQGFMKKKIEVNSGVLCSASDLTKLKKCQEQKDFCKKFLQFGFAKELFPCSGAGNRPALNEAQIDAILRCMLRRFPMLAPELDFTRMVNQMFNAILEKAKKK